MSCFSSSDSQHESASFSSSSSESIQIPTNSGLRILQINLDRAIAAAQSTYVFARNHSFDFLLVQEPALLYENVDCPVDMPSWQSCCGKAAIIQLNNSFHPTLVFRGRDLVAIHLDLPQAPVILCSGYSSPKSRIEETLQEIHTILRAFSSLEIFFAVDLNGHHPVWGYRDQDARGQKILDFFHHFQYFSIQLFIFSTHTIIKKAGQISPSVILIASSTPLHGWLTQSILHSPLTVTSAYI